MERLLYAVAVGATHALKSFHRGSLEPACIALCDFRSPYESEDEHSECSQAPDHHAGNMLRHHR